MPSSLGTQYSAHGIIPNQLGGGVSRGQMYLSAVGLGGAGPLLEPISSCMTDQNSIPAVIPVKRKGPDHDVTLSCERLCCPTRGGRGATLPRLTLLGCHERYVACVGFLAP